MKAAVIVFPGTNRAKDMLDALCGYCAEPPRRVWYQDSLPGCLDLIVLPGGFSYGDYLRAGALAARTPMMDAVRRESARGVRVLGVCNGFQILCESGLLPGALLANPRDRFVCAPVHLHVATRASPFTRAFPRGKRTVMALANGHGCYRICPRGHARLLAEDRIAFRYGSVEANESTDAIAGVLDVSRRVLGLMPHPENRIPPGMARPEFAEHDDVDGRLLFRSLVEALA